MHKYILFVCVPCIKIRGRREGKAGGNKGRREGGRERETEFAQERV